MKLFLRVLGFVLLTTVVLVTLARREDSGAWIAFVSERGGVGGIFLMTGDGGSVRRVTPGHLCALAPNWSPDGARISFIGCDNGLSGNLVQITIAGTNPQVLSQRGPPVTMHEWSANGRRVLVRDATSDLYIVEGGQEHLLGTGYVDAYWSADEQWVYAYQFFELDRIHVETGHVDLIPGTYGHLVMGWSLGARQIVLTIDGEILIKSLDGSQTRYLSIDPYPRPTSPVNISDPQWSPDGEWIAFLAGSTRSRQYIYRVRPNGDDLARLSDQDARVNSLQWSADGEWLLFDADFEGYRDIFRIRAEGSSLQKLTAGSQNNDFSPRYAPKSRMDWHPLGPLVAVELLMAASFLWKQRR
jgi:dipeptidyl aminopeptidase/acylaminoacyl peptidase